MTSTIRPSIHLGWIREPKITHFFISLIGAIFKIMSGDSQHQTYLKKKKPKQNEKERDPTAIKHPPSHQQQESQPTQSDPNLINYKPVPTAHEPYCTLPKLAQPTNSCTKPPVFTLITTWPNSQWKYMLSDRIKWKKIIHMTYLD